MIKVNIIPQKRYRVVDVATALGISQNSIYGFFNNDDISTKGGLTIEQIMALARYYANAKPRRTNIRWDMVREIRETLKDFGIEIVDIGN